jgi:signal transduction histidine kinase
MNQFMLLLGLASVATVALLGWLLHRRVLLPVRELRAGALALGRGEEVRLRISHHDELGDLAATFAAMATQLQESRADLERRVDERTREVLRTTQLAQLGTLAAGIAHEINNPLASIAACAEGLLREPDAPRQGDPRLREYLQIIRKEAMRTRDITMRLLRFAHAESNHRQVVSLATELREVAPLFEHQMADAGVKIVLETPAGGPNIVGDPSQWRQVLFNLLRNALDASPSGGRIVAACKATNGSVQLTVSDDGPGIPEAARERIFEPFFTTKEPGRGTGLGLAIVHRIVTAHGGTIAVDSAPGGGARFVVTVPAA